MSVARLFPTLAAMPPRLFLLFGFFVTLAFAPLFAAPAFATLPTSTKRVLFLGDSITYGGHYTVCVEAYFATRAPDRKVEFINVGLSSETVAGLSEPGHAGGKFPRPDLHERLARILAQTKPDLVFACYGMNDGIYLPLDGARFAAFQSGLRRLRTAVLATGANLVHLTPPVYVDVKGNAPTYAAVLDRYAEWMLQQRTAGWDVADVHGMMKAELAERRKNAPGFMFGRDGVHPDDAGHWVMARALLLHLGAKDIPPWGTAEEMLAVRGQGPALLKVVRTRSELMRDAWLTATGHQRPGVKAGLTLADALRRDAELRTEIKNLLTGAAAR